MTFRLEDEHNCVSAAAAFLAGAVGPVGAGAGAVGIGAMSYNLPGQNPGFVRTDPPSTPCTGDFAEKLNCTENG